MSYTVHTIHSIHIYIYSTYMYVHTVHMDIHTYICIHTYKHNVLLIPTYIHPPIYTSIHTYSTYIHPIPVCSRACSIPVASAISSSRGQPANTPHRACTARTWTASLRTCSPYIHAAYTLPKRDWGCSPAIRDSGVHARNSS